MSTQEVADKVVKLCSEGKFAEAMELYSPDIVSMEAGAPPGQSRESKGLAAVKGKASGGTPTMRSIRPASKGRWWPARTSR